MSYRGEDDDRSRKRGRRDAPEGPPRVANRRKLDPSFLELRRKSERESHTLFVRNVAYELTAEDLRSRFGSYGELKDVFDMISTRGLVFVSFYDIRSAIRAKNALNGFLIGGRAIDVHYSLPKDKGTPANVGAIVLSTLDGSELSRQAVAAACARFGEVKEVYTQIGDAAEFDAEWEVQFYDLRSSEKAHIEFQHGRIDGRPVRCEFTSTLSFAPIPTQKDFKSPVPSGPPMRYSEPYPPPRREHDVYDDRRREHDVYDPSPSRHEPYDPAPAPYDALSALARQGGGRARSGLLGETPHSIPPGDSSAAAVRGGGAAAAAHTRQARIQASIEANLAKERQLQQLMATMAQQQPQQQPQAQPADVSALIAALSGAQAAQPQQPAPVPAPPPAAPPAQVRRVRRCADSAQAQGEQLRGLLSQLGQVLQGLQQRPAAPTATTQPEPRPAQPPSHPAASLTQLQQLQQLLQHAKEKKGDR